MNGGPADRIRALLKERGWSQRELARKAGFNPSQVGNILANLDADPGAIEKKTAEKIAAGFGVAASSIFFDDVPAALAIDRTHADPPPPPSRANALQRGIWEASRTVPGTEPEDYDAARAAGTESAQYLDADGDVLGFAESLLRAAISLRRDGRVVNTAAILTRVAAGRTFGAEARHEQRNEAVDQVLDERAAQAGLVRGEKKEQGAKIGAEIARKQKRGE